jgi:uncharacterized protein (TIGR01777 family)
MRLAIKVLIGCSSFWETKSSITVDLYYFLVYKSIKRSLVGFMKAVITGATGLIGRLLAEKLNHPMILTRRPKVAEHTFDSVDSAVWIPDQHRAPSDALEGRDVIFHLAGEPVATGRWTAEKKRRIHDSRVLGTRHLVQGIADCKHPPKVLITASAVGFYGDRGDDILDERAAPGSGFLPQVCRAWEEEAMRAQEYGVRVVCLRIGIVLAKDGGALAQMVPIFRLGAGGKLGDGKQWMPWIHVNDVVGMLLWAAGHDRLAGPLNGVAPAPVTNATFTRALAQVLKRPAFMPVPRFGLHLLFGEKTSIILASQRVVPKVAIELEFPFEHTDLSQALQSVVGTH